MEDQLTKLLETLRASAAERDKRGGHPEQEKRMLRDAGLLPLSIPVRFGGSGRPWPEIYRLVRRVAEVDSALAHLLAFHHLQVVTVLIYGSEAQQARWLNETIERGHWWGNAMNPLDQRLKAEDTASGLVLDGVKGFCSGTRGSSLMTLSALHKTSGKTLLAVVRSTQDGIEIGDDWDPIGQRQTDSGSVTFSRVPLPAQDVLRAHDAEPTAFQTLRTCFAQLVLVNLYAGIAAGALEEARRYAQTDGRPWIHSSVTRLGDDTLMLQRFAEMHVQVTTAAVMADRAASLLEQAFLRGPALTAEERAQTAIAIAEAKVVAHRAGLHASQELFEVAGARGTKASFGLDRFWRNIRTHTLHDPLDYKLQVLGRWALNGEAPSPTLYN